MKRIAGLVQEIGIKSEMDDWSSAEVKQLAKSLEELSSFVVWIQMARVHRLKGNIVKAQACEGQAEKIYLRIPNEFRW